ncbi:MAG TPA: hypothetical protein VJ725_27155 [Thermoanaerobaculia bacterium]|nr:hypothetical protein [Thermoanaerobaculia bacterium]
MRVLRPFAVLLLLVLGASGAAASPVPRPADVPEAKASVLHLPSFFARLESLLASVWSKAGCRMDPWGRCIESTPTTEAGCRMDPLGLCEPNQ